MQETNFDTLEMLIIEQGVLACKAYENEHVAVEVSVSRRPVHTC